MTSPEPAAWAAAHRAEDAFGRPPTPSTWHCLICGTRGGGGDPAWTRHYIAEHIRDRYDDEGDAE